MTLRARWLLALAAAWIAIAPTLPATADHCCPVDFAHQELPDPLNEINHYFEDTYHPGQGTSWRIRWAESPADRGLMITGAWFQRKPGEPEIQVVGEIFLTQIYVPYHTGCPRIRDLTAWGRLNRMFPEEGGACGGVGPKVCRSGSSGPCSAWDYRSVIMQEVRPYGLSYTKKDKADITPPVFRRGQKFVIWGTYDADNYEYVMEYSFRDDGTIELRLGSTGFNNPARPEEAHMHTAFWHINLDIDGPGDDMVNRSSHHESALTGAAASDSTGTFSPSFTEGWLDWDPLQFTSLIVTDKNRLNLHGHNASWELLSMRPGVARHYDQPDGVSHYTDDITHHDFWVTRWKPAERWYAWVDKYADGESILWEDVVIWATSAAHHRPRSEDLGAGANLPERATTGAAFLMWSGFDIRPRDVFDSTPFVP
jgi:hypothetical protein